MMDALQHGLLGWLGAAGCFALGWLFCALCTKSKNVERMVQEAIRLGRKNARFARKARARGRTT